MYHRIYHFKKEDLLKKAKHKNLLDNNLLFGYYAKYESIQ